MASLGQHCWPMEREILGIQIKKKDFNEVVFFQFFFMSAHDTRI